MEESQNIEQGIETQTFVVTKWIYEHVQNWGVSDTWASWVTMIVMLAIAALLIILSQIVAKKVIHWSLNRTSDSSRSPFLRALALNKFPKYLSYFVPYSIGRSFSPVIFQEYPKFIAFFDHVLDITLVFITISIVLSLISSFFSILRRRPAFRDKPMSSYMQVIRIIMYLIGAVVIYSIITGKSPIAFFAAMGAASAILMLMFQDSIKGFMASIQVTTNDMVRIGDWITVPSYGADGKVIEINLTTVKIQNFDMTITTMPTYSLVSGSFQNWRSMEAAGGRRIKRAVNIKLNSVRYITDDELEAYRKIAGLSDYIDKRLKEIETFTRKLDSNKNLPINTNGLTNLELFQQYILWYLKNNSKLNQNMTIMVRQLDPTIQGVPIEIYAFSGLTDSQSYESLMSSIFTHIYVSVRYFDLNIFEASSSTDPNKVLVENISTLNKDLDKTTGDDMAKTV